MSSSTSDTITAYLSHIQQEKIFTKERFANIRLYFFRFIGLLICLYTILKIPILLYFILKFLLSFIFQIFSIMFRIPLKFIQLLIPKTMNYIIIFPLFCFCSLISFLIAKFSFKNIGKSHSLMLKFSILIILQTIFILRPITISIQEQRNLSLMSWNVEHAIIKLDRIEENNLNRNMPSSMENNAKIESDVEDEQRINKTERSSYLQVNNFVDSSQQFSSKLLENSSNKIEQNKITEKRKTSFFKSILEPEIFHQFIFNIQQIFSLSKQQYLSHYSFSSINTAFTDLNCYDYRKLIYQDKQNYIYFLNTYRQRSPFTIYLSIIKFNGPICSIHSVNSSCAVIHSDVKNRFYRFIRFWMIMSISIIIFIIIYKRFRSYQCSKIRKQSFIKMNPPKSFNLDEQIEKKLRLWLEQEQNNEYKNLNTSCCQALNQILSTQYEQLKIETLQFSNAKLRNISQTSIETIIINALLNVDHLNLNVLKDQQFSIKITKLTGELDICLIENKIEVKLKKIQMDSIKIIDSKNILTYDEKESIIKLLKDIIHQMIVECSFYLSDNQETVTQPIIPPIASQPSVIQQQYETPIITPIEINNHQEIFPEKEVKKLLIRIVKAVQLHDVEQPYCILELNHPKQIHQTSLAKNGLNPFWDERFLFECNDKSNRIRLQIIDRKKPNKKHQTTNIIEIVYADVSIPFSYVTSTIYKQDVQITPQYPDSIIRIEFSTLTEDEALVANNDHDIESITNSPNWSNTELNKIEHNHRQSTSDEILTLAYNTDGTSKGYTFENNIGNYPSPSSHRFTIDRFSTTSPDDDIQPNVKSRKSRSFMNSFRIFSRRKKSDKQNKHYENGFTSPMNSPIQTNSIPHSFSAEPVLSSNSQDQQPSLSRHRSISRSFRKFFKRKTTNTNNFILDHPDLQSITTPTQKKRTFFQRFRFKQKQSIQFSTNSLNSEDCTRSESVRNTPVRANVGRPVTMT